MSNHRSICHYCKNSVLNRDVGAHILKNHQDILFTKDNLKSLHKDRYLKQPLEVFFDSDTYFFCLADNSCIKKSLLAEKHFKGKADRHKEVIMSLREKYPLVVDNSETKVTSSEPMLSLKEKKTLQECMALLISRVRELEHKTSVEEDELFDFDKKVNLVFSKIGIVTDDKSLQELYPNLFVETKKESETIIDEEVTPLVEDEDDILSYVPEKKMTLQDVISTTLTDKDVKNLSTSVTTGQSVVIPELQQILEVKKTVPIIKRSPKPVVPVTPAPVLESIPVEQSWNKISQWQRFKQANEGLSIGELIMLASQMGIHPDEGNTMGILQHTKLKRGMKQTSY